MNFVSQEAFDKLEKRLTDIQDSVKGIKSNPIIQGYHGKRMDLNDDFNVLTWKARIASYVARIVVNETDIDTAETDIDALQVALAIVQAELSTGPLEVSGEIIGGASVEALSSGYFYLGAKTTDGSWRIGRSGNNFVIERRESGNWVTKQTWTP